MRNVVETKRYEHTVNGISVLVMVDTVEDDSIQFRLRETSVDWRVFQQQWDVDGRAYWLPFEGSLAVVVGKEVVRQWKAAHEPEAE